VILSQKEHNFIKEKARIHKGKEGIQREDQRPKLRQCSKMKEAGKKKKTSPQIQIPSLDPKPFTNCVK
jgi:hypothetical protein